jgi:hypothetical protein
MAVIHTETIGTTDYGFDFADQEIEVEAGVVSTVAADLKLAIRQAEASQDGIVFDNIAETGNPVILTAASSTFQVIILLENWKLLTLSTSGTFTVEDGNTVHKTDGIDIFAANVLVSTINNISAAGVLVTSVVGSGVTQQDKDDIEGQIFSHITEGSNTFEQAFRIITAMAAGDIEQQPDGSYIIKSLDGLKDRISGELASNNGRTINSRDTS